MLLCMGMKVKFLKDVTVDVMEPWTETNDTVDKLMRQGQMVNCSEIVEVSGNFSSIWTDSGDCLISVRNDCFEVIG